MKKQKCSLTFLTILLSVILIGCTKENVSEIDISLHSWKLNSVTKDNISLVPDMDDFAVEAYLLEFNSDSTFHMSTSVNYAGGKYSIETLGKIKVHNYHPFTEICCETEFDDALLAAFAQVSSYETTGNRLIFKGIDLEIDFGKN